MAEIYVSAEAAINGADPRWEGAGRVHEWRNHVPDGVIEIWHTFTQEQRAAIVGWAEKLANAEEWE